MATIAFVNNHPRDGHPEAVPFYRMFPHEPVLPGSATIRIDHVLPRPTLNLADLLREIVRRRDLDNMLIVCHGVPAQMKVPLTSGRDADGLSTSSLRILDLHESGQRTDAQAAAALRISVSELANLTNMKRQVRARRIGRIEIRACLAGQPPTESQQDFLQLLKRFFGANSVCAPLRIDFFSRANVRVTTHTQEWSRFTSDWPHHHTWFTNRFRFTWHVDRFFPYNFHSIAASVEAVRSFVDKTQFPSHYVNQRSFPLHALLLGADPYRDLVFPRELDFGRYLRRVT